LFARSPFRTGTTALLIFAALVLSYAGVAALGGIPLLTFSRGGVVIPDDTRGALVLSLLIVTALGMQRYARLKDIEDLNADGGILRECMLRNYATMPRAQFSRRLGVATALGVALGVCVSVLLNFSELAKGLFAVRTVFYWFLVTNTLLAVLFARGLELTSRGGRATRQFIDEVPIDLLRIDQLSIIGRSAARTSLIWFSVSAVSCLFFVSGLSADAAAGLILACAGIGIAIFVLTMERVHKRIKKVKATELERVRGQIDGVRHDAHANADASLRLQGLITYEKRIESAPEWPFDQTTVVRLGASTLILAIPWFGQALAQSVIDHLGHLVH
jgi:hypothetical protein